MWSILKSAAEGYIAHGALSRGAAIAFYVVTSLAPVLLIVVAVSGMVFGQDAVRGGLVRELSGLFGQQGGELIQTMLARSTDKESGATASVLGAVMVLVTASGVFGEMQTGLNQAWHVRAPDQPILSILRARVASLGLVAALGFLLISLAASTALAALGTYLGGQTPFAPLLLAALNTLVSLSLFTLLFAYKVLPDTPIAWRELGASVLSSPPRYLRSANLSLAGILAQQPPVRAMAQPARWSSFYCGRIYRAQIFLFGAELTRAVAEQAERGTIT